MNLTRTVRFGDTDAGGVIHFHHLFRWCHEAWEESLEIYGLSSHEVFPLGSKQRANSLIALPIVHCEANYYFPIKTGDSLTLEVNPKKIDRTSFQVVITFELDEKCVAIGSLKHCAINIDSRNRIPIPEPIEKWIEASSLNFGITSLD